MPDFERMSEILAVVGPRRAGKTFFMYQIIGDLMASGACQKDDVLFVDFEDYRLVDFTPDDTDSLFTAFNQLTGKSPKYVFFDEVQHLPSWSRVLRTLHNRGGGSRSSAPSSTETSSSGTTSRRSTCWER